MKKQEIEMIAAAHRHNLASWLQEWEIDAALRSDEEEHAGKADGGAAILAGAAREGSVVEVEQIRLLYPDCRATRQRPFYIALLRAAGEDAFLAAPFSRFEFPALPGEWLTGREESQLRVLCLWNAAAFKTSRLESGWEVDRLTSEEMRDALAVYAAVEGESALPARLQALTGPALRHPDDPRWIYREQEQELMQSVMPGSDAEHVRLRYELRENGAEYLPRAADSDNLYDGEDE